MGQPVHLPNHVVLPGECLDLPESYEAICREAIRQYVQDGILSVGVRPPSYAVARARQERLAQANKKEKSGVSTSTARYQPNRP